MPLCGNHIEAMGACEEQIVVPPTGQAHFVIQGQWALGFDLFCVPGPWALVV